MSQPPITNWKDQWNFESDKTREMYADQALEDLLDQVERGKVDFFYTIWDVILEKCQNAEQRSRALETLWRFLKNHPGEAAELHRYHCAGALFEILRGTPKHELSDLRKAVQWDHHGEEARQEALEKLWEQINPDGDPLKKTTE